MSLRKTALYLSVAALVAGGAVSAQAAGFQLKEQGSSLQGLSFAGATAKSDDLSTLFFNSAGMMRLDGTRAETSATYIRPSATFKLDNATPAIGFGGAPTSPNNGENRGGDAGDGGAVVPAMYAMTELNKDWRLGLSINTPFGLATKYDENWVGRYYGIESSVQTINFTPSLATRLTDGVYIGGGIQFQYITAKLTNAINTNALTGAPLADGLAEVEGDDIGFGFTAGVLWEPNDTTRIGLNYRSRVHHELDGDLNTSGMPLAVVSDPLLNPSLRDAAVTAKVTTPDIVSFGISHDLTPKLTLLADVAWTNWSLFKTLEVKEQATGNSRQKVNEDWDDTWFFALGTEYKYNDKLKLRAGAAYDQGAVGHENRTFRIPDSDRYWLSVGAGYQLTERLGVDVGYSHLFASRVGVREDDQALTSGVVTGKFDANVDILTAGLNWKF